MINQMWWKSQEIDGSFILFTMEEAACFIYNFNDLMKESDPIVLYCNDYNTLRVICLWNCYFTT